MVAFNVRKWLVSTTMITMAMIMINSMRVAADGQKLDGKIDLVIITSSLSNHHAEYKQSISTLPNFVEMGNDKVRVAIVSQGSKGEKTYEGAAIEFPLSGDQSEFKKWIESWNLGEDGYQQTNWALKLCLDQIFDFNDNDRAKIVIIHIAWYVSHRLWTQEEAERLRKLGVRIYVVYNVAHGILTDDISVWTTSARVFEGSYDDVAQRSMEKMPNITSAIVRDLCGFCRFDEQGSCIGKLYEGADDPDYFGDNRVKCQAINPADIPCMMKNGTSKEECDFECNRRWSWEKIDNVRSPKCDQLECGMMKRIDDRAPPHMEYCPREFDCSKPVCTTTTSTAPSTTTTTTAASTMTTMSSTISSIATTAESTPSSPTSSSSDKPHAGEGDPETSSGSDGLPVWVIPVIAVVALMLLLAVIIGTVVVMKKRKNAREKKEKMERAKRQEEIEMEKKRQDAAARSKSASKSVFGKDVSTGSKTKGAQASVLADMSMAPSTARQSKKTSADCKIKSKGGSSPKSPGGKRGSKDDVSKKVGHDEKPSKKPTGVDGSKMAAKSSQVSKMADGKKPGSKSSVSDVEKKKSTPSKMESSKMPKKK